MTADRPTPRRCSPIATVLALAILVLAVAGPGATAAGGQPASSAEATRGHTPWQRVGARFRSGGWVTMDHSMVHVSDGTVTLNGPILSETACPGGREVNVQLVRVGSGPVGARPIACRQTGGAEWTSVAEGRYFLRIRKSAADGNRERWTWFGWLSTETPVEYETGGEVVQEQGEPAYICWMVLESYPPQCGGGIRLAGWDWEEVGGEEHSGDTHWGSYEVTVTYDGTSLHVTSATHVDRAPARIDDKPARRDHVDSSCPEPAGGWIVDPSKTRIADRTAAFRFIDSQDDYAGSWISYSSGGQGTIVNAAFTGNPARHEDDIRALWGGGLCLYRHLWTAAQLEKIRTALYKMSRPLGLQFSFSDIHVWENQLVMGATIVDDQVTAVGDQWPQAVQFVPLLRPVEAA